MSGKKESEKKENKKREHRVEFDRPQNNEIGSNDARLEALIAQSHLSGIIRTKNGGYPASKRVSNS